MHHPTLHLFNGDSTLSIFTSQNIPGETAVWREVLCEGPTIEAFASPAFWALREQFINEFFDAQAGDYQKKTIREFEKVEKFRAYEEMVLWFEYDLFCQLNMIGLLAWLGQQRPYDTKVSLICLGTFKGQESLVTLGEVDPQVYPELYAQRRRISQEDLDFAQQFWAAYCTPDHSQLLSLAKKSPSAFPYLHQAIQQHQKRFPSTTNGLNNIEEQILQLVRNGHNDLNPLMRNLLQSNSNFGFGDLQYEVFIEHLRGELLNNNPIKLTPFAQELLEGKAFYNRKKINDYQWGGTRATSFNYDVDKAALIASI